MIDMEGEREPGNSMHSAQKDNDDDNDETLLMMILSKKENGSFFLFSLSNMKIFTKEK